MVNVTGPGDRLLVISNGYFGDRFTEIGRAHGLNTASLRADWGQSVTASELDAALRESPASVVTITHVETSTGVAAPLAELVSAAKAHGALVIVDSVCALGAMPVSMDQLGADVVLSGAQKALGVPPGMVILAASERVMGKRRSLPRIPAYYADLLMWENSMADPQVYFSTHAVNMFYGLAEALDIVREEGLTARFARHEAMARAFRAALNDFGFTSLTDTPVLAATLSVLEYPAGIDDAAFRNALSARGVIAAGCLGEWKGRGVRFGHMGNVTRDEILEAIGAIGQALSDCNRTVDIAAGVRVASEEFGALSAASR